MEPTQILAGLVTQILVGILIGAGLFLVSVIMVGILGLFFDRR